MPSSPSTAAWLSRSRVSSRLRSGTDSNAFHFLDAEEKPTCLRAEPVPACYGPSQALAATLLYAGSAGIVFPSVRHAGGTCVACFRPALVSHPRRGRAYRIDVKADEGAVRAEAYDPQ